MSDSSTQSEQLPKPTPRRSRLPLVIGLAFVAALCLTVIWWSRQPQPDAQLQAARAAFLKGQHQEARRIAEELLDEDPDLYDARVLVGDAAFAQERYDDALQHYQKIPVGPADAQVHAQLRRGRILMHHSADAPAAEAEFRSALRFVPNDRNALFQLASLLGIQSRRSEAVPFILQLYRLGHFHPDFLTLLEDNNGALFNPQEMQRYHDTTPDDPSIQVGLAWYAQREGDFASAERWLISALATDPQLQLAHVRLAQLYLDQKDFSKLNALIEDQAQPELQQADFWIVRAALAEHNQQTEAAVRCYWEALQHDSVRHAASWKIHQYLTSQQQAEAANWMQQWLNLLLKLRSTSDAVASRQRPHLSDLKQLIDLLSQSGRLWEAWGWSMMAQQLYPNDASTLQTATELFPRLRQMPLRRVCVDTEFPFDLSHLPLPQLNQNLSTQKQATTEHSSTISFRDDAATADLRFKYFNSPSPAEDGQRMYEFNGGGCGVIDIDGDGWPDLHLTQGCRWSERSRQQDHIDRLFRNVHGKRFVDVSTVAGIAENNFSTGVAVGDFNNDGFSDCYVANIGGNRLFRNNGDGTFYDVTDTASVGDPGWSTSCTIADLDGDAVPDIYSVNYLEGEDVFDTVCQHDDGRPRMCMPFHFPGAQDQFFCSRADGSFENRTEAAGFTTTDSKGLGVVIADWDPGESSSLEVFVANDTVANSFFVQTPQAGGDVRFSDRAMVSGLALNAEGRAEGCMGIAVGDADSDGRQDLFVTNFLYESNTFYRCQSGHFFTDSTAEFALDAPSIPMLGFGTQFLDADLDGHPDLIVTNGHIDDYSSYGRPYRMPTQLFQNTGHGQFRQIDSSIAGPYFSELRLGRSLARWDWNGDGREDAVISNLQTPVALLTNTTAGTGNFISLQLRGVQSARDAIGTNVTANFGDRSVQRQLTAGDGYQASNERLLVFGLADAEQVDRLDVAWPSGMLESIGPLSAGRHYVLIEGSGRAVAVSR